MITAFIAVFLFCGQANAQVDCGSPQQINKIMQRSGFSLFAYTVTQHGFLLKIWVGDGYFITAEDEHVSCVLTSGASLYVTKGFKI